MSEKRYQLKVMLEGNKKVWRKIDILGDQTLHDLHMAIQEAFDWDNDHLYSFFLSTQYWKGVEYSGNPLGGFEKELDFFGEGEPSKPSGKIRMDDLRLKLNQKFKYLFDYGDEIRHAIEVVEISDEIDKGKEYPRIVEAKGEAPAQYGN